MSYRIDERRFIDLIQTENIKEIQKFLNDENSDNNINNSNIEEPTSLESGPESIASFTFIHEIWKYKSKDNDDASVLHLSIFIDNYEITKVIVNYCKKHLSKDAFNSFINNSDNKGVIPLHYAFYKGNIFIIRLLIENNANLKALTKKKLNSVHFAAQGDEPNSLYYLKYHTNIDFKAKDSNGSTPLHWATFTSSQAAVLYLLKYGADINAIDNDGNTPLHLAVITQNKKMITKLLQNGADIYIKNKNDLTARELALKKNLVKIAGILKDSEKCAFCAIKAPVKKIKKSRLNILITFSIQIICCFILLTCLYPQMIYDKIKPNNENKVKKYFVTFHIFLYYILTLLFFIMDIYLINSNPGRAKNRNDNKYLENLLEKGENLKEYCPICRVSVLGDTKHCVICDKCCEEFDHHCYWVNNCIGKRNFNSFYFFLLIVLFDLINILVGSIYCLFLKYIDYSIEDIQDKIENIVIDFPLYIITFRNDILFLIFNITVVFFGVFFLIPVIILVIIHTRNIFYNRKIMKKRMIKLMIKDENASKKNNDIGADRRSVTTITITESEQN